MDDLINEFLQESNENLDRLDRDFVELEKNPGDKQLLASIFRAVHTIKGTCGMMGFHKLESVTHVGENLLGKLRDGKLTLTVEITNALLALVDAIRTMVGIIEKAGNDGEDDYPALKATLTRLLVLPEASEQAAKPATNVVPAPVAAEVFVPETQPAATKTESYTKQVHPEVHKETVVDTAIRVNVSLLDKLMNLVGELVLSRNQVLQLISTHSDANLVGISQRLNLITTELQEGIMKTRMQPIGNIWSKYPRVVRDLAAACNKKVKLEMEGQETELDKSLIESIKDPLTHIVRNSVDHGIESSEKRKAAGKPEEGTLRLKAFHEGGQVIIEITDDGNGINPDKIREKAVSKGLITPEQADRMSDQEAVNLIFLPGFSMAEKVSNVSGRGVGMDVVKTNIEKINGIVDIQSRAGQGTMLKLKIPLTLAIIPALVVNCGNNRFAIPQSNLLELVLLDSEKAATQIEMFQGAPVYRLRGRLLPLVYLNKELKINSGETKGNVNIVVLSAGERQFGLVVDGVFDTQEIVVKPLGNQLKGISVFAGATIMGDGSVALILDVLNVARQARVIRETRDASSLNLRSASVGASQFTDEQTFLVIRTENDGRVAIPLAKVARLEEVPVANVEKSGGKCLVQYRGHIMPLIGLSGDFSIGEDVDSLHVVVFSHGEKSVGLVVERILDVVQQEVKIETAGLRHGVIGTMVIQERVTDILNIDEVVSGYFSEEVVFDKTQTSQSTVFQPRLTVVEPELVAEGGMIQ